MTGPRIFAIDLVVFSVLWTRSFLLTCELAVSAVAIALLIGVPVGWAAWLNAIKRLSGSGRSYRMGASGIVTSLFLGVAVASLIMPLVLHAAAWESAAGKFGWWTLTQTGSRRFGQFSGLIACSIVHGIHGSAAVALATWIGLRRIPGVLLESSRLDTGPLKRAFLLLLPMAAPWIATAALGVGMLAATEMTVADLYGFRTLADEFYLFHAAEPSAMAVMMVCFIPMLLAIFGGWMFRIASHRSGRPVHPHRDDSASQTFASPNAPGGSLTRLLSLAILVAFMLVVLVIPVGSLIVKAGHDVTVVADQRQVAWSLSSCIQRLASAPETFRREYVQTAMIAGLSATVSTIIGGIAALGTATRPTRRRCMDGISLAAFAIPGPIVGLGVIGVFQWPIAGLGALYQQTLVPTQIALCFKAVPVAYFCIRVALAGRSTTIRSQADLDAGPIERVFRIWIPMFAPVLAAAWITSAVVASGDVPVLLPVVPPGVTTVTTRLFGLLHSGARYQEAALAFWYVAATTTLAITATWIARRRRTGGWDVIG
ncbi:ABC transporter permease [Crateriforma spongiae]|uniref:ABC transporter permease n=1 Tax=Crateriforma spongiae TaxID=2724528 RepID=UPI0014457E65|nr:hypothetical protein [Crateriforma spongiae]